MRNPYRGRIRSPGGFTFVEIITALVLLALFSAFAVPAMSGYTDKTRTRGALDHLVADIAHARVLAVEQGRRVRVSINDDATYSVDTLSTSGGWGTYRLIDLDIDYRGVTFTAERSLEFNSRGMLTNLGSDLFIRVTKDDARDSVFISPAGRIYRAHRGPAPEPT